MIIDLFSYFARFPDRAGVLNLFNNGASSLSGYATLLEEMNKLPEVSLLQDIKSYVFGQSFDAVKSRVDSISGTYLFVDFGEFNSQLNGSSSIVNTQKVACTVACKLPGSSDLVENAIASDNTLSLLAQLAAQLIKDAENHTVAWLSRRNMKVFDIIPFVAKELNSIGWTLMFSTESDDLFDLKLSFHEE